MLNLASCYFMIVVAIIGTSLTTCKTRRGPDSSETKFYGYDNQRFRLHFENSFLMKVTSDEKEIFDEAYLSLKFLFGVFQWHEEFASTPGIPHKNPAIKILKAETVDIQGVQKQKVTYQFDDDVVFDKSLSEKLNDKNAIEFWMPKDRRAIYDMAKVDGRAKCTHEKYYTEDDFWYFWNPKKTGCPSTFVDGLNRVKGTMEAIPNTLNKYPLYGQLGTENKRLIYVAHGIDKNYNDEDAGIKAWLKTIEELKNMGFVESMRYENADIQRHWVYTSEANGYALELHLGLYKVTSPQFKKFAREGLTQADIFIYNGHSGLGGHLPPSKFAPLKLPDKYQVFFFNGCSTFAYYNDNYFAKKKEATGRPGSEKLEIVTSGLEAWFPVQPYVTASLIFDLVIDSEHPKWEGIIANLYFKTGNARYGDKNQWSMSAKKFSAQYQVNGDEDNPSDLATALKR